MAITGCASPGPARPPSLNLPRLVTDLAAVRTGDKVTLNWTTPEKTTDGLKVQPTLTAEICRELPSSPCIPVKRIATHPGAGETSDPLPRPLTGDPAVLLTYRMQIFNANGHSAGLSSPAFTAAGAAPPLIEHLRATPIREGAMLEWQPQDAPSFVELDRILVQATAPRKPAAKRSLQLTPANPTEVHLQAGKQTADAGGTIDPTVQRGATYRYTAQRVRSVTLNGHALELRSAPSPTITAVMRDTFPPKAPTGLAAVPGSGAIDLSWEPNADPDLAGYMVYRQPGAPDGAVTGTLTRLTSTPIAAPAFSDHTALPGQIYSYRVTAIDTSGNESPASNEVQEALRTQ
ncbi:MAG: hypothetical protein ABI380_03170 [Edaphobacter sp.]